MARLPAYEARTNTIDIGNDTASAAPDIGSAFASGANRFGEGLMGATSEIAKAQLIVNAKADAHQKAMDGLEEQSTYESFKQRTEDAFTVAKNDPPSAGAGFTDARIADFDKSAKEYIGGAKDDETRMKRTLYSQRLRTGVLKASDHFETTLALNAVKDARDKTYADAGGIVGQQPTKEGMALGQQMLEEAADRLNLGPNVRARFLKEGQAELERKMLAGRVAADPNGVINTGTGIYRNLPTEAATGVKKDIIDGANAVGFDPRLAIAIGWIESKHNPNTTTSLSSARGTFQILKRSAYGDPNQPYGGIDPQDTAGQAKALGMFLNRVKDRYSEQGINLTPGQIYMFHNVGEGVAARLVGEKDGSKTMGQLLYETYGNSRFSGGQYAGQLVRDVVGRNNPSLYSSRMTVDQVRMSYERNIASAMKQADGVISEQGATADQVVKDRLSKYLGVDVQNLGPSELNQAIGLAQKQLQESNKKKSEQEIGYGIWTGQTRGAPNDPTDQKSVDTMLRESMREHVDGFEAAKPEDMALAREGVKNSNYIPKPYVERSRAQVHGQGSSETRTAHFEFLANVSIENKVAYDAAKLDDETEKRVSLYISNKERLGPKGAVEYVDKYYSPEGKQLREAVKRSLNGEKGELVKLKTSDFTPHISEGFLRNGLLSNGLSSDRAELFLEDARDAYRQWREDGNTPTEAKRLAAIDVAKKWGASQTFASALSPTNIMRYPPDPYYNQKVLGMQPFENQAREIVDSELARRYPLTKEDLEGRAAAKRAGGATAAQLYSSDTAKYTSKDVQFEIVSTPETEQDSKDGKTPRYQIIYRDPKDGAVRIAYPNDKSSLWTPNRQRMVDDDRRAELAGIAAEQARTKWWEDNIWNNGKPAYPGDLRGNIRAQFERSPGVPPAMRGTAEQGSPANLGR